MSFLLNQCTFRSLDASLLDSCKKFNCGKPDLDEFFREDCLKYSDQLLGKTYCFTLDSDPSKVVCLFTVSNESIKANTLPNSRKKKLVREIPHEKYMRHYPAVLIGRLGVDRGFGKKNIGSDLMDFIKAWFIDPDNKTGCRFVVVDAYIDKYVIDYYKSNGFVEMFSSEDQEKEYYNLKSEDTLKTRLMYFDLIKIRSQ
ncbi:MAG: N-acetyltransferase [Cyclobacteriaceae bacterium]